MPTCRAYDPTYAYELAVIIHDGMRRMYQQQEDAFYYITVTNENRPLYISAVARHRLIAQAYRQTQAFLKGLYTMIDMSWISMFNQFELQRLIGGDSTEIDVDDLRRNTVYSGVYVVGDDNERGAFGFDEGDSVIKTVLNVVRFLGVLWNLS